jgi:hypothetical protein
MVPRNASPPVGVRNATLDARTPARAACGEAQARRSIRRIARAPSGAVSRPADRVGGCWNETGCARASLIRPSVRARPPRDTSLRASVHPEASAPGPRVRTRQQAPPLGRGPARVPVGSPGAVPSFFGRSGPCRPVPSSARAAGFRPLSGPFPPQDMEHVGRYGNRNAPPVPGAATRFSLPSPVRSIPTACSGRGSADPLRRTRSGRHYPKPLPPP